MAYIKKIWKDYPDTTTQIKAEDLNNIENGIEDLDIVVGNGWIDANETWTYASVDDPTGVITISGDKTTKYSLGMRIMFTNATNVIYGIITAISYSSPNTTLTFLHEIDPTDSLALHLMQDSAITNNYYSNMKVPYGFPIEPNKWTTTYINNTTKHQNSPTGETWYNVGSLSTNIPIGSWKLKPSITCQNGNSLSSSANRIINATLSTTINSNVYGIGIAGATVNAYIRTSGQFEINESFSVKTPIYVLAMSDTTVDVIYINNCRIDAECGYL
jgi:hypothetical protein